MNWIDIAIIIIIAFFVISAYSAGLIRELVPGTPDVIGAVMTKPIPVRVAAAA